MSNRMWSKIVCDGLNSDEHNEFKIKCEDNHTPEDDNFQPCLRPFLLSGFLSAKPSPSWAWAARTWGAGCWRGCDALVQREGELFDHGEEGNNP